MNDSNSGLQSATDTLHQSVAKGANEKHSWDFDIFGLKVLWTRLPLDKLTAWQVAFITSFVVFSIVITVFARMHASLKDSIPPEGMLFILVCAVTWRAFFYK